MEFEALNNRPVWNPVTMRKCLLGNGWKFDPQDPVQLNINEFKFAFSTFTRNSSIESSPVRTVDSEMVIVEWWFADQVQDFSFRILFLAVGVDSASSVSRRPRLLLQTGVSGFHGVLLWHHTGNQTLVFTLVTHWFTLVLHCEICSILQKF